MQLLNLGCKDFLSYKELNLSFEKGLTYIKGVNEDNDASSNGAGKSSLFDMIAFALYGKTPRDTLKKDLIRKGCQTGEVSISFTEDEHIYKIIRRLGTKNYMQILCDEIDLSKTTYEETSRHLEELIKLPFSAFIMSTLFSVDTAISFSNATDATRKEFLDFIMNIDYKVLRDYTYKMKSKLTSSLTFLSAKIDALKIGKQGYEKQLSDLIILYKNVISDEVVDPAEGLSLEEAIKTLNQQYKDLNEEYIELRNQKSIISSSKMKLEKAIHQLNSTKSPVCPVCQRKFHKNSFENTMKHLNKELNSRNKDLKSVEEQLVPKWNQLSKVTEQIEDLKGRLQIISKKLNLQEEAKKNDLILRKSIQTIRSKISASADEISIHEKKVAELKKQVDQYSFWYDSFGLSGVRSYVYSNLLSFLNEHLKALSSTLFQDILSVRLELDFDATRHPIVIRVFNEGTEYSYGSLSGGERRRVDLILMLSIKKIIDLKTKVNFLFLDEVFDVVDTLGKQVLLDHLKSLSNLNSIFIVSHDSDIAKLANNILQVKKVQGVSNAKYFSIT